MRTTLAAALVSCAPADEASDLDLVSIEATELTVFPVVEALASPRDLDVAADGSVWVLNSIEPLFVGFSAAGEPLGQLGVLGAGPGEFRSVSGLVSGGIGGEAWAFDAARHAVAPASRDGGDDAVIRLPDQLPPGSVLPGMSLLGSSVRVMRMGEEVVFPRRISTGEIEAISAWKTIFDVEMVAVDLEAGTVRTLISLPEVLGDMAEQFDGDLRAFPPFPFWRRLWTVCGDELWIYDRVRGALRGFDREGLSVGDHPVPRPFTRVEPTQLAIVLFDFGAIERVNAVTPGVGEMTAEDSAQIIRAVAGRATGSREDMAAALPRYVDLRCSEDGTRWLQPLDLDRGTLVGRSTWLRIDPDGGLGEVEFPGGFEPFRFGSDRIWGVFRNELDVASPAWVPTPN